ncbi:MAG: ABC transporter ATP-binding protein [Pseudomonadota bacterium]
MSLEFVDIRHRYGNVEALANIQLSAMAGQVTCLLGPSGCGKTTLLRLAAGLIDVQAGEIRLDGQTLATAKANPPPEKRPVGLVFQEGALFPHLTVGKNIAFGLSKDSDKRKIVDDLLNQIGLSGFEGRYPHTLSGGQQQRVALARAIAPEPRVLLLDEPFANVDIVLRRQLREETRRVLKARGAIAVLVTHDPEEAMEIGDCVAVMEGGHILQSGSPDRLYNAPVTPGVGAMVGGGQTVAATLENNQVITPFGTWPLTCLSHTPDNQTLALLVRPDALSVEESSETNLKIEDVRRMGPTQRVYAITTSGERITATVPNDATFSVNQTITLLPKTRSILAFSNAG